MTLTGTTLTTTMKNGWEKMPGRTSIAPRALGRVVSAVTADILGVLINQATCAAGTPRN
jgi:hypothetical protein